MSNQKLVLTQINNNYDKRIANYLILFYLIESLNKTIKTVLPIPLGVGQIISAFFMIFLAGAMILSITPVIKRSLRLFVVTEMLFVFLYLVSFLYRNTSYSMLISGARQTLMVSIPLGIYVYSLKDQKIFYDKFINMSYYLIVVLSASLIYVSVNNLALYNMSISYSLLLPILFHIHFFFKSRTLASLLISTFGVISILFFGARGPLACIAFEVVVLLLVHSKSMKGKIRIISVFAVLVFAYFNLENIAKYLFDILSEHGLYSRTLYTLSQGIATISNSRDQLFSYYSNLVLQKPILGWGLLGGWIDHANGPHNMILEFFLAFGVMGGIILTVICSIMVLRFLFVKDSALRDLLIIYSSYNIVMYFIMGNFHEKFNFFILIFLFIRSIHTKNQNKELSRRRSIDIINGNDRRLELDEKINNKAKL